MLNSVDDRGLARFSLAGVISFASLYLVGWLVYELTPAVSAAEVAALRALMITPDVFPEPQERAAFIAVVLTAIPLMALAWRLADLLASDWGERANRRCEWALAGLLWVCGISSLRALVHREPGGEWLFASNSGWDFYLSIALAAVLAGWSLKLLRRENFSAGWRIMFLLVVLIAPLLPLAMNLPRLTACRAMDMHHLEILCYAVHQAARGVIEPHQYGWYGHFIAFLGGGGSFELFVGVCSFLAFVSLLMISAAAWIGLKRKGLALAFGGAMTVMVSFHLVYFQFNPIRMIFPATGILLALWYWHALRATPKGRMLGGGLAALCCGAAVVWNLDSAIPLVGAFGVMFLSEALFWRRWPTLCWFGAGFLAVAAAVFGLVLRGDYALLMEVAKSQSIFYGAGFWMQPMPSPFGGAWLAMAVIYMLGLLWGIRQCWRRDSDPQSGMILFITILGIGGFAYYQGRSHILSLIGVGYPAGLLAVWMMDAFFDRAQNFKTHPPYRVSGWMIGFLSAWFVVSSCGCLTVRYMIFRRGVASQSELYEQRLKFIVEHAAGRDCNIFGDGQGIYFMRSGLNPAMERGSELECILKRDVRALLNRLEKSRAPLFLMLGGRSVLMPEILLDGVIARRFRLVASEPRWGIFYLEPVDGESAPVSR